jgi:hypothetical protein
MRSSPAAPKTIAPSLPFPIGKASVHLVAGWRYQRTEERSAALIEQTARQASAIART